MPRGQWLVVTVFPPIGSLKGTYVLYLGIVNSHATGKSWQNDTHPKTLMFPYEEKKICFIRMIAEGFSTHNLFYLFLFWGNTY